MGKILLSAVVALYTAAIASIGLDESVDPATHSAQVLEDLQSLM
jgi:hypothetical protein